MKNTTNRSLFTPSRRRQNWLRLVDATVTANDGHDVLAQLLAFSRSQASAEALLCFFPSVGHVLSAEPAQLADFGISSHDLALFRLVRQAASRLARAEFRSRPTLTNWQALIAYLQSAMAYEQVEQLRILFLDRKNILISDEVQQHGTVDHTPVYPREVVKRALILNASAIIIVHNHPSGDPSPSRDDIEMTRQIRLAAEVMGVLLHDHLIIGHGRHSSLRALGLL